MKVRDKELIERCRVEVAEKLGWCDPQQWYGQEFQWLSEMILNETSIKVSETT
jgi:hypothetical protein